MKPRDDFVYVMSRYQWDKVLLPQHRREENGQKFLSFWCKNCNERHTCKVEIGPDCDKCDGKGMVRFGLDFVCGEKSLLKLPLGLVRCPCCLGTGSAPGSSRKTH